MDKTNIEFYGKRIDSFQALRGIAALLVVAEHVRFLQCGLFAVDIFFVLSGFMIIYSTGSGMEGFLKKRIIRIVPFYWLVTLITFAGVNLIPKAFVATRGGIKELLLSLFFIPFDMNTGCVFKAVEATPVMQPLMRIGWTLNLEMLFYVLFFVASKINYRFRALITTGFFCLLFIIGRFSDAPIMVLWGSVMLFEFSLGMALCYLCKALSAKRIGMPVSVASGVVLSLGIIILAIFRHYSMFLSVNRLVLWGIPGAIIVFLMYLVGVNIKVPKCLVFLGNISFSIYYMHYYIVQIIDRYVLSMETAGVKAFIGLLLALLLTVGISYVTYIYIEKKLTGVIRNNFLK